MKTIVNLAIQEIPSQVFAETGIPFQVVPCIPSQNSSMIIENAAITITNEEKQPIAQAKDFFKITNLPSDGKVQLRQSYTIIFYGLPMQCNAREFMIKIEGHNENEDYIGYSTPFNVINYGLKIVNEISPVWYKDEGGKNNTILIHLQLVDKHNHQSSVGLMRSVPLGLCLYYEDKEVVRESSNERLLEITLGTPTLGENGECKINVRIKDISKNHGKKRFRIFVYPQTDTNSQNAEIGWVFTTPIQVLSKRNGSKKRQSDEISRELQERISKERENSAPTVPDINDLHNYLKAMYSYSKSAEQFISKLKEQKIYIQEGNEQDGLGLKRVQTCRCASCFQYGDIRSEEHTINHAKDCQLMRFSQETKEFLSKFDIIYNAVRYLEESAKLTPMGLPSTRQPQLQSLQRSSSIPSIPSIPTPPTGHFYEIPGVPSNPPNPPNPLSGMPSLPFQFLTQPLSPTPSNSSVNGQKQQQSSVINPPIDSSSSREPSFTFASMNQPSGSVPMEENLSVVVSKYFVNLGKFPVMNRKEEIIGFIFIGKSLQFQFISMHYCGNQFPFNNDDLQHIRHSDSIRVNRADYQHDYQFWESLRNEIHKQITH